MSRYGSIVATGSYLPEIEVTNDALRLRFDGREGLEGFVDKMEAATAIRRRWYAPEDWATSDLAVRAPAAVPSRSGC
jgi:3-oxoacyl-[acyl-carrier-protein] synthase III